jgi:hypothetical protein
MKYTIFKDQADMKEDLNFIWVEDAECILTLFPRLERETAENLVLYKNFGTRTTLFEGNTSYSRVYNWLVTNNGSSLVEYDQSIVTKVF